MDMDPFLTFPVGEEQEEDVCRVCRLEEDEENPMVHPCKCSGSVRFVHPDCLKSWLASSQKKSCEICGHRYTFTKVYPDDIPETIPPHVYVRQFLRYILRCLRVIYRFWIVMVVWLIVLPMANMGGLKTFRWFADGAISGLLPSGLRPSANATQVLNATLHDVAQNATTFEIAEQTSSDVLQVVLTSKLGPGLSLRIAKRLWRMYRGSASPNITVLPNPPPTPPQVRSFLLFSYFDAPSPYRIFQGQMLSIALAATIVSMIFLREWYASYNWTQHEPVDVPPTEDIVVPEEWVIRRGIAERRYTQLPNGKLVPISSKARRLRRDRLRQRATEEDKVAAGDAEWTDEERGWKDDDTAVSQATTPPNSLVDRNTSINAGLSASALARHDQAADGPGPSTLAFRASAASISGGSEYNDELHTDDQLDADIRKVQSLVSRAEAMRKARENLTASKTADAAWKAPELLDELARGKGKEKEVVDSVEEVASSVVEAGAVSDADEGTSAVKAATSEESELDSSPPIPRTVPALLELSDRLDGVLTITDLGDELPTTASSELIQVLPSEKDFMANLRHADSLAPLKRLVAQLSADLAVLSDRRMALHQDVKALGVVKGDLASVHFARSELDLLKERMEDTEAASVKVANRLKTVVNLTVKFSELAVEVEEILSQDDGEEASKSGGEEVEAGAGTANLGTEADGEKGSSKEPPSELSDRPGLDPATYPATSETSTKAAGVDNASSDIPINKAPHTAPALPTQSEIIATALPPLFRPAAMPWDRSIQAGPSGEGSTSASNPPLDDSPTDTRSPGEASAAASDPTAISEAPVNSPHDEAKEAETMPSGVSEQHSISPISQAINRKGNDKAELAQYMSRKNQANDSGASDAAGDQEDVPDGESVGSQDQSTDDVLTDRIGVDLWHEALGLPGEDDDTLANGHAGAIDPPADQGGIVPPDEMEIDLVVPVGDQEEEEPLEEGDAVDIAFEDEDEEGGWAADDWDQILEVIGLVGPFSALLQNLVLAIAVMGAAMSTCVLFPMTSGKIFLSIDPIRTLIGTAFTLWKISRKLLRWTRYLTDPIIDIGLEIMRDVVLRPMGGAFAAAEGILARLLGLKRGGGVSTGTESVDILTRAKNVGSLLLSSTSAKSTQTAFSYDISLPQILTSRVHFLPATLTLSNPLSAIASPSYLIDNLERLGDKSYNAYEAYRAFCVRIAMSNKLGDAVTCLAIGYLVGLVSLTGLAWMGEQGVLKVGDGWKQGLRRYRLSVKLTMFLALELVAFPLGAGALIALSTIPLISSTSIWDRLDGIKETAFGMVFVLWLIGTMFMYGFAQVLAWCRSFCRPGALYFIRDPHDPKYSPVKEIIERSTMAQFHKLGISTIMYSFLIWWVFGAAPWVLRLLAPNTILPLRLDKYGPISPIPFDYIFLVVGIPPTIYRIRPQHTLRKLLAVYWRLFERLLRLDHLLYADKASRMVAAPVNPGRTEQAIWKALDIPFTWMFGSYESAATLARVPAQDRVHLLSTRSKANGYRREGMFVLLTERGQPKTPNDKVKMIRQDLLARRAERDPKDDFKIVHLPDHWRTRVHVFILTLLAGGGIFMSAFVLGPVVLGREILKKSFGQVHDGYSFLIGAYTIYAALVAGRHAYKITITLGRARQRRLASRQALVKRFILTNMRRAVILVVIYIVHPILKGLVWEFRAGMLIRYGATQAVPVIHMWDVWALGSILNSIELGACGLFGRHRGGEDHVMHHHDLRHLTIMLFPVFRSLSISLILPLVYTTCAVLIFGKDSPIIQREFRKAGAWTWAMRAVFNRIPTLGARWKAWRQKVIDAEYVVEERVENYEPEPVPVIAEDMGSEAKHVHGAGINGAGGGMPDETGTAGTEVMLDDGEVLLVPAEELDNGAASDSDEEEADGVGTGEASEADLE